MKRIHQILILAGILLLAAFLRFYQLGVIPPSPDWDEAALGYNAYSVLQTGRDEYGVFLPRELRSFDDYKPPLYMYLAIPPVALFGLTLWAVRLPSAVMGILAVFGTFVFVRLLFVTTFNASESRKKGQKSAFPEVVALLSAFLLAISPWHLQFSRIAFEANTGSALHILGVAAFFLGLRYAALLPVSAFAFGLSLYAYHTERIFAPLLVLILTALWRRELFRNTKAVVIAVLVGIITVLPLVPVVMDTTAMTRLKGTSPLSDQTVLLMRSVEKIEEDRLSGDRFGELFDNRRIVYAKTLIDGYISHFSLKWLFLTGDNDRHHAPDNGLMYLWELPFLLLGISLIWRRRDRVRGLVFGWLLIAPLAASPTSGTPHAIRTLAVLPVLQIATAYGLLGAWSAVAGMVSKGRYVRFAAVSAVAGSALFMVFITAFYFHMYYSQMNREFSQFWQYGYKQAVEYAEVNKHKYEKIVVSTVLEQPHMFFLFYTKYDPVRYQAEGGTSSGGFAEIRNRFGKYEFRPIVDWVNELHDGTVLYIGTPQEVLHSPIKSVYYLNGKEAIRIGE